MTCFIGLDSRSSFGSALGVSLVQLFAPCAATIFGHQVPFSRGACAAWRSNRLRGLCSRIRHPSEVSTCSILRVLHRHGRDDTWPLLRRVPSFRGSRRREPCGRSRPRKDSSAAIPTLITFPPTTLL